MGFWQTLPAMSRSRGGIACSIYQDYLWVIGGDDGTQIMNLVEVYDPRAQGWSVGCPMHRSRAYCTSEVSVNYSPWAIS